MSAETTTKQACFRPMRRSRYTNTISPILSISRRPPLTFHAIDKNTGLVDKRAWSRDKLFLKGHPLPASLNMSVPCHSLPPVMLGGGFDGAPGGPMTRSQRQKSGRFRQGAGDAGKGQGRGFRGTGFNSPLSPFFFYHPERTLRHFPAA